MSRRGGEGGGGRSHGAAPGAPPALTISRLCLGKQRVVRKLLTGGGGRWEAPSPAPLSWRRCLFSSPTGELRAATLPRRHDVLSNGGCPRSVPTAQQHVWARSPAPGAGGAALLSPEPSGERSTAPGSPKPAAEDGGVRVKGCRHSPVPRWSRPSLQLRRCLGSWGHHLISFKFKTKQALVYFLCFAIFCPKSSQGNFLFFFFPNFITHISNFPFLTCYPLITHSACSMPRHSTGNQPGHPRAIPIPQLQSTARG